MPDLIKFKADEDEFKKEVAQKDEDLAILIHRAVSFIYILVIVLNFIWFIAALIVSPVSCLTALWVILCMPISNDLLKKKKTLIGYIVLFSPLTILLFMILPS